MPIPGPTGVRAAAQAAAGLSVTELDTPALVLDLDRVDANIRRVQEAADRAGARLRPHAKTHKMTAVAHRQVAAGAVGITVAKTAEAEVMVQAGLTDVFIANSVVGAPKLARLRGLAAQARLAVGVDHVEQARAYGAAFAGAPEPLEVLIEVDTGQHRAGVLPEEVLPLARRVAGIGGLRLRGVFTHEGHAYGAQDRDELARLVAGAHRTMAELGRALSDFLGRPVEVSTGCTPALDGWGVGPGITELRPGTYVFYDAMQAGLVGHTDWCAATVLATITSTPAPDRAVADAGAKSLSSDRAAAGLLRTTGHGIVLGHPGCVIERLSDEHAVIRTARPHEFAVGEKIRIIPNHICPCVNLYDVAYAARGGVVEAVWAVSARGCVR